MSVKKCPLNIDKDCGDWCAWFVVLKGRNDVEPECAVVFIQRHLLVQAVRPSGRKTGA